MTFFSSPLIGAKKQYSFTHLFFSPIHLQSFAIPALYLYIASYSNTKHC